MLKKSTNSMEGVFQTSIDEPGGLAQKVGHLSWVMNALVVVLLLGFLTALISVIGIWRDAFSSKEAAYQNLIEKVYDQNTEIQKLQLIMQLQQKSPQTQPPQQPVQ